MTEIDKKEKRAALKLFRVCSYLKSIKLYHEDRDYLINEVVDYYYYDLEYYRFLEAKDFKEANLAASIKATKLSNIVQFFERHNKFAYYHLTKMFNSVDWKIYATDYYKYELLQKQKKDADAECDNE